MYFIYILRSDKNRQYYIGSCKDLKVRLIYHNNKRVRSTKANIPWQLVYSEKFDTLAKARRREFQIKSWKSRIAIENLSHS